MSSEVLTQQMVLPVVEEMPTAITTATLAERQVQTVYAVLRAHLDRCREALLAAEERHRQAAERTREARELRDALRQPAAQVQFDRALSEDLRLHTPLMQAGAAYREAQAIWDDVDAALHALHTEASRDAQKQETAA